MDEKDEMHWCHGSAVGKLQRQRMSCDRPYKHTHAMFGCTCASQNHFETSCSRTFITPTCMGGECGDKTGCAVCMRVTRKQVATHALFKDIDVGVSSEPLDPSSPSMEPYPNIWREKHTYKGSTRVVERGRVDKLLCG